MDKIAKTLDALFTRYLNLHQLENGSLPTINFDPRWPSTCDDLPENEDSDIIRKWKPVQRDQLNIFDTLESALEMNFHHDFKAFYGAFWSNGICVEHITTDGETLLFNLIQIWNEQDQEQLKENMLGHAFAKKKGKLPLSLFIGCTDGNEIITIDNASGEIMLERPGFKAHKTLAKNLETFLLSLKPTLYSYD